MILLADIATDNGCRGGDCEVDSLTEVLCNSIFASPFNVNVGSAHHHVIRYTSFKEAASRTLTRS